MAAARALATQTLTPFTSLAIADFRPGGVTVSNLKSAHWCQGRVGRGPGPGPCDPTRSPPPRRTLASGEVPVRRFDSCDAQPATGSSERAPRRTQSSLIEQGRRARPPLAAGRRYGMAYSAGDAARCNLKNRFSMHCSAHSFRDRCHDDFTQVRRRPAVLKQSAYEPFRRFR